MKKDKLVYEAPEAEIFEIRFSENMLTGSPGDANNGYDGNGNDLGDLS